MYFAKILVSLSCLEMPNTSKSDEAHIRDSQHSSCFNSVLHLKIIKITADLEVDSGSRVFKEGLFSAWGRDFKLIRVQGKKIIFFFRLSLKHIGIEGMDFF